jgi:hypothetical protein
VNAGWQASSSWTLDDSLSYGLMAWPDPQMPGQAWFWLCVPKMSSVVLTSRVASRPFGRDDHRSCACGSSFS